MEAISSAKHGGESKSSSRRISVFKGFLKVVVLFRVNCTIPTLSKSKTVREKYCIVLPGEGNEFKLSTKDTFEKSYVPSEIIIIY